MHGRFWALVTALLLGSFMYTYMSTSALEVRIEDRRVELKSDIKHELERINAKLDQLMESVHGH